MIKKFALTVVPFLVLGVAAAQANTYDFAFSGGGVFASGILTTAPALVASNSGYGEGYQITNVSGTLISPDLGGAMSLIGTSSPGALTYSPSGAFIYDDLLFPASPTAPLDYLGWMFYVAGPDNSRSEVNVFSSGGAGVSPVTEWEISGFNTPVSFITANSNFTITATPEPGFYGALALGFVGLVAAVRRRRQNA